jgi:hypothetical protein
LAAEPSPEVGRLDGKLLPKVEITQEISESQRGCITTPYLAAQGPHESVMDILELILEKAALIGGAAKLVLKTKKSSFWHFFQEVSEDVFPEQIWHNH